MRIFYEYKDKAFDDIRDIVNNNKLEIDYEYLFCEYLPFQIFITGKTAFKGLRIGTDMCFWPSPGRKFDRDIFDEGINGYLDEMLVRPSTKAAGAISGGVDSSVVALMCNPHTIYSGYYEDLYCEYDETYNASLIADILEVKQVKVLLDEASFIAYMDSYLDAICTPIGGFGGVMELAALSEFLTSVPDIDTVYFGNGGDEIFMGYYWNYFMKHLLDYAKDPFEYMPNFVRTGEDIVQKIFNSVLISSISRLDYKITRRSGADLRSKITDYITKELERILDPVDRMLHININKTLPTLLHLNNQMCKSMGVTGLNPLANKVFIKNASEFNRSMAEIPKERLRWVVSELPVEIKKNYVKRGFPIPLHRWDMVNAWFVELWEYFSKRGIGPSLGPYPGLNRVSWAVANIELFLRRYGGVSIK